MNSPRDKNRMSPVHFSYSLYAIGQIVIDKLAVFLRGEYYYVINLHFPDIRIIRGDYF